MAKRCNEKRVTAQAVEWGKRGACLNDIAPGIIVTPLALDEFNGPRGDFYKNMFAKCPAGRPGTADEVANVAELLMTTRARSSRARPSSSTAARPRATSTARCAPKKHDFSLSLSKKRQSRRSIPPALPLFLLKSAPRILS